MSIPTSVGWLLNEIINDGDLDVEKKCIIMNRVYTLWFVYEWSKGKNLNSDGEFPVKVDIRVEKGLLTRTRKLIKKNSLVDWIMLYSEKDDVEIENIKLLLNIEAENNKGSMYIFLKENFGG